MTPKAPLLLSQVRLEKKGFLRGLGVSEAQEKQNICSSCYADNS